MGWFDGLLKHVSGNVGGGGGVATKKCFSATVDTTHHLTLIERKRSVLKLKRWYLVVHFAGFTKDSMLNIHLVHCTYLDRQKYWQIEGSGCVAVGRATASHARDPRFECSHQPFLNKNRKFNWPTIFFEKRIIKKTNISSPILWNNAIMIG